MSQSIISLRHLKAASFCASSESTRCYLNGVYVTVEARCSTYVATDGHVLFACRSELFNDEADNTLLGSWIIPIAICAPFKFTSAAILTGTDKSLNLAQGNQSIPFEPVDGSFPDWRRVIPSEASGKSDGVIFDVALLSRLAKAGAVLGLKHPTWVSNGENAAPVCFGDSTYAFGVVMPMRSKNKFSRPDWSL
jgi:hypothetical protein